jgi:tetratricopeptide (TPR) repeat protein
MKLPPNLALVALATLLLSACGVTVDGTTKRNQGDIYIKEGNYNDAEKLFSEALSLDETRFGRNSPSLIRDLNKLGLIYLKEGRSKEAIAAYERAVKIRQEELKPGLLALSESLNGLGNAYFSTGNVAAADDTVRKGLGIREDNLPVDAPEIAESQNCLAPISFQLGDAKQSEQLYKSSLAIYEQKSMDSAETANVRNNLASLYAAEGKYGEAEPLMKWSLSSEEKIYGGTHPELGLISNNLGELYRLQKKWPDAEAYLKTANHIYEQSPSLVNSPLRATVLNNLALTYSAEHKNEKAELCYKSALKILHDANADETRSRNIKANYAHLISNNK